MLVNYIGVQKTRNKTSNNTYYKVRFSVRPENASTDFTTDDGDDLAIERKGEVVFDMKCTEDAFHALPDKAGTIDMTIEPNPANPRNNIITGVKAAPPARAAG